MFIIGLMSNYSVTPSPPPPLYNHNVLYSGYIWRDQIWRIANFLCFWQILIWRIGRDVSLRIHTVNENGGFILVNGEKIGQIRPN